jgi:hypothetical protein
VIYNRVEKLGIERSVIGLGGHEYLPDGSSRGFNDEEQEVLQVLCAAPTYVEYARFAG